MLKNAWGHLKTITKHKLAVMRLCFRCGLILQGLLHDNSKYGPSEFLTGVRYYQGTRSPNAAEKQEKGYSGAWLHHKGRNRHHLEYWIDISPVNGEKVFGAKMPLKYVIEMCCDRIAACKVYHGSSYAQGDALEYWEKTRYRAVPCMHPDTVTLLEKLLHFLAEEGEERTVEYMRWLLKHPEEY